MPKIERRNGEVPKNVEMANALVRAALVDMWGQRSWICILFVTKEAHLPIFGQSLLS